MLDVNYSYFFLFNFEVVGIGMGHRLCFVLGRICDHFALPNGSLSCLLHHLNEFLYVDAALAIVIEMFYHAFDLFI